MLVGKVGGIARQNGIHVHWNVQAWHTNAIFSLSCWLIFLANTRSRPPMFWSILRRRVYRCTRPYLVKDTYPLSSWSYLFCNRYRNVTYRLSCELYHWCCPIRHLSLYNTSVQLFIDSCPLNFSYFTAGNIPHRLEHFCFGGKGTRDLDCVYIL